jgi:hypothetical protein
MVAAIKGSHDSDARETSVRVFGPSASGNRKGKLVRYLVLAIAFVAVVLLIAIALYYTQRASIHIQHVSSLAPQFVLRV